MTIISISGLIGSGKDTIADYLVEKHGFVRESYASTLKDAVAAVFNWDRALLEGRTSQAREWREQVDVWWANRLGIPQLTPRWVLQQWGTDVLRKSFHDDIWIASLENKLARMTNNVVVTDCRFPNEATALRNNGAILCRVRRGPDPEWFDDARESCISGFNHMKTAYPEVHASEYSWIGLDFDHIIENDSTLDALIDKVNILLVK